MIAQELEVSLHMAFVEARQQRHEFITVEHLLLALLDNPSASEVLRACAAEHGRFAHAPDQLHQRQHAANWRQGRGRIPSPRWAFQRVIQRAIMHVQSTGNGKKEVTGANVLVAIFGEKDSHAGVLPAPAGRNAPGRGQLHCPWHPQKPTRPNRPRPTARLRARRRGNERSEKASPLEQYTLNLNQAAREGKIEPLIGRDYEVERTIQILCRRRKNNPLLVGEAGVGKTAIAEGLAWRITEGKVPEVLEEATVVFAGHGRAAGQAPSTGAILSSA